MFAAAHAQADEQRHERAERQGKESDLRKITEAHISNKDTEGSGRRPARRSRENRRGGGEHLWGERRVNAMDFEDEEPGGPAHRRVPTCDLAKGANAAFFTQPVQPVGQSFCWRFDTCDLELHTFTL